ncbi:DNA/RNA non-specific endonuclease [Sphingomonas kyungheensis]|uniref:DNA/RNA non-specific endonuclease n=1 Tax=Sphingomonas kyungheensis TaxID=1069987 RepID=A0ABU8H4U8_9SPHN
MQVSIEAKRRAYAAWLRTGRWPVMRGADGTEWKFNPYHDPKNGRFTTAGGGQAGTSSSSARLARSSVQTPKRQLVAFAPPQENTGRGWGDGGFTGPGGGSFGGGGASGHWTWPAPQRSINKAPVKSDKSNGVGQAIAPRAGRSEHIKSVVKNGYTFTIHNERGLIGVSGNLSQAAKPFVRSRQEQATAGGPDRRPTDDGGHYIATRFNGPSDAFNHFAQDANFNRGRYRRLEDQWARVFTCPQEGQRLDHTPLCQFVTTTI